MKKIKQTIQAASLVLLSVLGYSTNSVAQCFETLGSSPNIFTTASPNANQIIVNNDLNTVIFLHRNDPSVFPGTDNGIFKYDISTDNGATWQVNQGNLNPNSTLGVKGARYPQVGIYNPSGNTSLSNASLVYHGPTNSGFDWNGYVSGSLLLNGSATATENYNQAGVSNTLIPGGFCQSAPGIFWTVDQISDNDFNGIGLRILKGVYSAGDVNWTVNTELTPSFNIDYFGNPIIQSVNMAFDPTGMKGYVVMLSHLNGLSDYVHHPVVYSTIDGGVTWSGPVQLDLNSIPLISGAFTNPGTGFDIDIAVDNNGHAHMLAYVNNSFDYSIFINAGKLVDFIYDGISWSANEISTVSWATRVQISRSEDGTKLVYAWVENDVPSSSGINAPNLKAVTYDVPTGSKSCPVTYSNLCPSILNGQMYQTTVSPNMIEEGGLYTVPVVLTIYNASGNANDPAQHYYLNDLSFTGADFIANAGQNPVYPTITVNGTLPFCFGGSASLTASGGSSYLWSTGETTATINATGGYYWVVNPSDNTCVSSVNSIFVESIYPPEIYAMSNPVICPGSYVELVAYYYSSGGSILWSNGETTQSIIVTTPGIYSVTVDGCTSAYAVEVTSSVTPSNDNLCNAQQLTVGVLTPLDNNCATAEANEPAPPTLAFYDPFSQDGWLDEYGYPVISNSVWFSFIAPSTGAVNISTDGFNTQLALYSSSNNTCSGILTLVAANDDGGDPFFGSSLINRAYCLKKGKRYFVQVDSWYGYTGQGTILVTAVPNTVTICHNGITKTVSGCALAAHLAHGDVIGDCPPQSIRLSTANEGDVTANSLHVYPNPSEGNVNYSFESETEESYSLKVVDITGRVILSETKMAEVGENKEYLNLDAVNQGMYFLVIEKGENIIQTRIIKQ